MKKFTILLISFIIVSLLGLMGYNYTHDTSGLFDRDFSKKRQEPNQHIVKMQYVLQYPQKYDAFAFGASTLGNLDLTKANDGYRYYNMTYSAGIPYQWLDDLKILLQHDIQISRLIISLDAHDFYWSPSAFKEDYLRMPYSDNPAHMRTIYLMYLLKKPSKESPMDKDSIYDIYDTGRVQHSWVDAAIEDKGSIWQSDDRFKPLKGKAIYSERKQALESIREIKRIALEHNIKITFFWSGPFRNMYLQQNITELNQIKKELVEITDFYDFSGLNDVTTNAINYYDDVHYRPIVGDRMMDRMFYMDPYDNSQSFGFYVTKDNIDEHIKKLDDEIMKWNNAHPNPEEQYKE